MSPIHFHTALGGSILRLWRGPSPRAYSWSRVTLFSFHSASRIHPAPSARPFSKGLLMERNHSLFLLYSLEDPSCAFGAPLLQGPTHGAESLSFPFIPFRGSILRLRRGPSPRAYSWSGVTLFSFYTASRIHPAPLAQPFSKGLLMERSHSLFLLYRFEDPSCAFGAALLQGPTHRADSLSFPFIPPRGSILRLWRSPFPRAYSWSRVTLFPFYTASRNHPAPLARPFFKGLLH